MSMMMMSSSSVVTEITILSRHEAGSFGHLQEPGALFAASPAREFAL